MKTSRINMGLIVAAMGGLLGSPAYHEAKAVGGRQPWRGGTAGMAYGTKTRGNLKVRRAATKARNQARHRKACKGC